MRLLFMYFYKEFGTFEKGSIIHLSKKYKFTLNEKKSTENEFYFNKEENPNFIEDFYSKNIDIGVLIGENGTGKSVLLNSIRDKKNEYSICIYEENNNFYVIENDLFKIKENEYFPLEEDETFIIKIDNNKISQKRKFKSIYYSSILEKTNENLNDDFDVSNMYLLNEMKNNSLEKKLELLEISDLHRIYDVDPNPSKTFFEDAKEFIKDSYILLFEKTMEILNENKDYEKIEKVFNKLPDFIKKDYAEEYNMFFEKIINNQNIVRKYINSYKELNNIKEDGKKEEGKIELFRNHLFTNEFFENLFKITFTFKTSNLKDTLQEIGNLFHISENENNIYSFIEEVFEECLKKLKSQNTKIDNIKKVLEIYKLYYLKEKLGLKNFILIDLFKEKRFKNILLLEKKDEVIHSSIKGEKLINYKEVTINEIKKIIEDNYSLFYDEVINDLENLDDKILKLLILKKVEEYKRLNYKENDESYNAIYVYLAYLLKSKFLENYEKEFLSKKFEKERSFNHELIRMHNDKCKNNSPLITIKKVDFDKYNEFIKDTIHPFSFTYNPPISSGQKAKEIINARINDSIKKINQKNPNENILILLDEADLKLHLEWQRKFVCDLIKFLNSYPNNKFFILYATHSPMILSDITNDRVVFLKKRDDNANFSEDKQDFTKSTFGANIYDIYSDSFFVNNFMGEFAQNKINEVIKIIDEYKEKKEKNPDEFMPNEKALDNLKVVKSIGEPLLRNKLEDEIKSLVKDDIMEIVNNLKDKKNEEIEKELEKYSQFTQTKVLMKLLEIRK